MKTFRNMVFIVAVFVPVIYIFAFDKPIHHDIKGEALSLRLIERRTLFTTAHTMACEGFLMAIAIHLFWVRRREE